MILQLQTSNDKTAINTILTNIISKTISDGIITTDKIKTKDVIKNKPYNYKRDWFIYRTNNRKYLLY